MDGSNSVPAEPARYATPSVVALLPEHILDAFGIEKPQVEWLSGGRTNRTMRVRASQDLVVQQMRCAAHGDLLGIMENLVRVTSHLDWRRKIEQTGEAWYPELVPAANGKPFIMTEEGDVWRAFSYRSGQILRSTQPASALASAGAIYGRFAAQTADIGGPDLIETAPGFHDIGAVYRQLMADLDHANAERKAWILEQLPLIEAVMAQVQQRCAQDGLGEARRRVVHNDTKLSNVLFHDGGEAKAVLDLDLAMMGPSWHDVGDLVRSASWHAAPGGSDDYATGFTPDLFAAVVGAFVEAAAETLTDHEVVTYAAAGPRISLELGLRYLNDHLRDEPHLRVEAENGHFHRGITNVMLASEMLGAYDALRLIADGFVDARHA